jgi:hypothetical protein
MILLISVPLALLIVLVSLVGLLKPGFYSGQALNWQVQTYGQDLVDLFLVVPALIITCAMALRRDGIWRSLWAGVLIYIAYTFVIYSFEIHFNVLFLPYCLVLGLSVYGIIHVALSSFPRTNTHQVSKPLTRLIAAYFLAVAIVFYFLWLMEIIPANLSGVKPHSLTEAGLSSNPVYILDLAIVLPGIFIAGVLLLRRHVMGIKLGLSFLVFFILTDISIAVITWIVQKRLGGPGVILLYATLAQALLSAVLLTILLRRVRVVTENYEVTA